MSVQGQAQKRNKQTVIIIIAAIIGALLIFGGGAYLFTRIFTGHVRSVEEYPTMQLESTTYSNELQVNGAISAGNSVTVSSKEDGTVAVVAVAEGDKVQKGDVLFTMENDGITSARGKAYKAYTDAQDDETSAAASYKSAQKSLDKANKQLTKAQDKLTAAEEAAEEKQLEDPEYEFDSDPYDTAISVAEDNVSNCENQVKTMKEAYEKAQKEVTEAKETYDEAEKSFNNLTVKATAAGTVSELNIEEGTSSALFNANGGAMKIVDTSSLCCVVQVPESQINNISEGQTAQITCTNLNGKTFDATVSKVSDTPSKEELKEPAEDGNTTCYDVTLALDKISKSLKVGLSCTASIHIQDFSNVYYVPKTAVSTNSAGTYVEVVSDSTTTKQYSVTQIGVSDDGENLIVQGMYLSPGMSIRTDLSSGN